jgi:hypothetical protein
MSQQASQTIRFRTEKIRDLLDVIRLRTLVVRQLSLESVIFVFRLLHFSVIERLTLAQIFDPSELSRQSPISDLSFTSTSRRFDRWERLRQSVARVRFPALKSVSFFILFPGQM